MNQSQNIKIPTPLHGQLKALAAARSTTMVEIIADTVRKAVEAGEIAPESAGLSVGITLDLDAADEAGRGPWAVIKTNDGEMPYMSRVEAEIVADRLLSDHPNGPGNFFHNRFGSWTIEVRGTSIKLVGVTAGDDGSLVSVTMAPVVARALATQLRKLAPELAAEARL